MTERVRALLDLDHLRVIEELTAARRRGGGETFREELFGRLGSSCPVPAYVLWAEQEELFTLPAMREVYRALRSAGHLHMALEVLTRIAQRTEAESDQTAVRQLDEEAAALLRGVELQEPGEDGGFTETILVVEDAESLARQEKDLADLPSRLTAQGYDVVLGLMGVEEVPPRWESSRVRHLSLPAPSGLSSRREALGSSFDELLGELRPSLVLLRLSALEAPHLSEKARARRVPTAWDLRADELRRRKQRRPGHCAVHPSRMDEALEQDFLTAASRASVLLARDQRWAEELAGQGADSVRAVTSAEELLGHLLEVSRMGPQERRSTDRSRYSVSVEQAEQWAATLRENPVKDPYQWFHARAAKDQDVMRDGWVYEGFEPVLIAPDMDWHSAAVDDRSWGFHLHAWEFMDPVIQRRKLDETGPELEWCLDIAASWSRVHLGETPVSSMAWYDMALSWRSPRLASLLHLAVAAEVPAGRLVPLFELVLAHVDAHFAKDSFAAHNNHGFYAALGQLVLAQYLPQLPLMDALRASGEERMEVMATSQFLRDGGHSEHSPDYHRMLLGSFEQAISQGLIENLSVVERITKASEALGWFVQPDGGMLQFGDSPKRQMVRRKWAVESDTSRFVLTDGRDGVPQEQELFVLPETGYAIVRSPQPQAAGELATGSYLALAAGFHSRAHKHCDDLSLVWTHRGREILVDGGRYGYGPQLPKDSPLRREGFFYAAPERQYVESVAAHNTAALDGKNHDRKRPPYGSALQRAVEEDGAYVIEASAPHTGWHHDRRLRFAPSGELLIEDTITAEDEEEHTYSLYFNIDGSWNLDESCGSGLRLSGEDSPGVAVSWAGAPGELRVARGEKDPLRGWRSKVDRQLEEAWSVERTGVFRGSVTVQTIFTVQDPPPRGPEYADGAHGHAWA